MVTCLRFGPIFLFNSIKYAAANRISIEMHQLDFAFTFKETICQCYTFITPQLK